MDKISNELNKLRIDQSERSVRRSSQRPKTPWILAAIILGAGGVGSYSYLSDPEPVSVTTVKPRAEASEDSAVLIATGYVIAQHKIQVGSKIAGRVAWIGVQKGDKVTKDQVIVRLEDREYRAQYNQAKAAQDIATARLSEIERGSRPEEVERARAEVQRAMAALRSAEATFKRVGDLVREGIYATQMLDDARGKYEEAVAVAEGAMRTLEIAQKGNRSEQIDAGKFEVARTAANTEYAKSILDSAEIRAPQSGTILERNVEQGEMVTTSFVGDRGAKSFVVTLADLKNVQVELDINQNDFNRISPGQPCTVVTDAFPDRTYSCAVDEIAPEADRQKATVQVKVRVLDPDEYVMPEMNARVSFLDPEKSGSKSGPEKLFVIPKSAMVERNGGKAVFVVTAQGIAQIKQVEVTRETLTDVYIANGLNGEESIVTGEILRRLSPGDRVATHVR